MKLFGKKRILSLLLAAVAIAAAVSAPLCAYAYPGGYSNTHSNTGDQRYDVAAIARTQVGYKEDSSGTKYGAWYKSYLNSSYNYTTAPWCAMFVLWCENQAGCSNAVKGMSASSTAMLNAYKKGQNGGKAYSFSSGYVPRKGDIIFVGYSSGSEVNHTGLVVDVDDSWIYTIEGNHNNAVCSLKYKRSSGQRNNSSRYIKYFGVPSYSYDSSASFTAASSGSGSGSSTGTASNTNTVSYSTTVTATSLNVRSSASPTSSVVKRLSSGTSVKIVSEAYGADKHLWGKLSDGSGWICLYYASCGDYGHGAPSVTGEAIINTGKVSCSSLNVREKASSSSTVTGTLSAGANVALVETKSVSGTEWGRIAGSGWVCLKYVTLDRAVPEKVAETVTTAGCSGAGLTGTVTASNLNVRSTPGTGSISTTLKKGASVTVFETKMEGGTVWGRTSSGWISMAFVSLPTYQVAADGVHVRASAGTSSDIYKTIPQGTKLTIDQIAESGSVTWGHISSGGWVSMAYVSVYTPAETAAAPAAAAAAETSASQSGSQAAQQTASVSAGTVLTGTATSNLNVREKPVSGAIVTTLKNGASVSVTEVKREGKDLWGKTENGWVSLSYVDVTYARVTVSASSIYIRKGAGAWYSIYDAAQQGNTFTLDSFKIADDGGLWGHIASGGYLCIDYVEFR